MGKLREEKGFAIIAAMAVSALLLAVAGAAMLMSQIGYMALSSEKKFQLANWAAEYAVNQGILNSTTCSSVATNCPSMTAGGTCTYFGVSGGSFCFVYGTGQYGSARIVKTAVVPKGTAQYGALTLRNGGVLQLGGSSAIVNCDTSCGTPGVVYGGSITQQINGGLHNTTSCPNNPSGIYGTPNATQNGSGTGCASTSCSSTVLSDRVPVMFQSTDWSDLRNDLSGTYNGITVDVTNLSATGLPSAPSPACTCTGSVTLTSTSSSCTGVASFSACGGSVKFTGSLTIQGIPGTITNIVSNYTGGITVSGVSSANGATFADKNIYTTASTGNITINDSDVTLNNTSLVAGGGITLQNTGTVSGSTLTSSSGSITIQSTSGISDSVLVSTGATSDITLQGGTLTNSTVVTKDTFTIQSSDGSITDTNIFSNTTIIQKGAGDLGGGILYSQGGTTIQGTGGGTQQVGTTANPTLLLTGGDLTIQNTNGTTNFNGLVFANGRIIGQSNGNYGINGAVVSNSTASSSVFQSSGNASINFDIDVLTALYNDHTGLMQQPTCGGGGAKTSYVSNSKVTVY